MIDSILYFSFFVHLWFSCWDNTGFIKVMEIVPSSSIFYKTLCRTDVNSLNVWYNSLVKPSGPVICTSSLSIKDISHSPSYFVIILDSYLWYIFITKCCIFMKTQTYPFFFVNIVSKSNQLGLHQSWIQGRSSLLGTFSI